MKANVVVIMTDGTTVFTWEKQWKDTGEENRPWPPNVAAVIYGGIICTRKDGDRFLDGTAVDGGVDSCESVCPDSPLGQVLFGRLIEKKHDEEPGEFKIGDRVRIVWRDRLVGKIEAVNLPGDEVRVLLDGDMGTYATSILNLVHEDQGELPKKGMAGPEDWDNPS